MNEQLSALIDNELTEADTLRLLGALKNDAQLKQSWDRYHILGDALRKMPQISADFSAKVMRRLASEPTVLAPQRKTKPAAQRFALPLAASFAAVSLVGLLTWQMTQMNQSDSSLARLAAAPSVQRVAMTEAAPAKSKTRAKIGTEMDYLPRCSLCRIICCVACG